MNLLAFDAISRICGVYYIYIYVYNTMIWYLEKHLIMQRDNYATKA